MIVLFHYIMATFHILSRLRKQEWHWHGLNTQIPTPIETKESLEERREIQRKRIINVAILLFFFMETPVLIVVANRKNGKEKDINTTINNGRSQ